MTIMSRDNSRLEFYFLDILQGTLLSKEINNYFVDIGDNLASKLKHVEEQHKTYAAPINAQCYDLSETANGELITRVNKLSSYKSAGLQSIRSTLMKGVITALIESVHLYNVIIRTGIFPDAWKLATVTPITKYNSPKINIYSLIPGKVTEQIMHDLNKIKTDYVIPVTKIRIN